MKLFFISASGLLLSCSLASTFAFAPLSHQQRCSTTLQSSVEKETSTSKAIDGDSDWIAASIASSSPLDHCVVGPKEVVVFDTTLRDGTQGENVAASCDDKLKIAARLGAFEVDYIEAGWPGSNPQSGVQPTHSMRQPARADK